MVFSLYNIQLRMNTDFKNGKMCESVEMYVCANIYGVEDKHRKLFITNEALYLNGNTSLYSSNNEAKIKLKKT